MNIIEARPLPQYRLALSFSNGEEGIVDLSDKVGSGVFAAWENPASFAQVKITAEGAVEWPGEIDLCSDALYLQMTGKQPVDIFSSLQPEYA
jgi:hypothetical protein